MAPERPRDAVVARLAAAIERAAADLPLTEEPARFGAILEAAAPGPAAPAPGEPRERP